MGDARRRAGKGRSTMIEIGDGAWVGGGAIVVGPCVVGRGAVVAAGEVVRKDVPPNHILVDGVARSLGSEE